MNQFNELDVSVLRSELKRLPDIYRIALELRFWEHFTIEEIATVLRADWDWTDRLINEAMDKLKAACLDHPLFAIKAESDGATKKTKCIEACA